MSTTSLLLGVIMQVQPPSDLATQLARLRQYEIREVLPVFQTLSSSPTFQLTLASRSQSVGEPSAMLLRGSLTLILDGRAYPYVRDGLIGMELEPQLPGQRRAEVSVAIEEFLREVAPPVSPGRHTVAFRLGDSTSPEITFVWHYNARYLDIMEKLRQ